MHKLLVLSENIWSIKIDIGNSSSFPDMKSCKPHAYMVQKVAAIVKEISEVFFYSNLWVVLEQIKGV